MATAFIHSFSYAHIIILSWCLLACEANNSWPEKKCKGMQTTESVHLSTLTQLIFFYLCLLSPKSWELDMYYICTFCVLVTWFFIFKKKYFVTTFFIVGKLLVDFECHKVSAKLQSQNLTAYYLGVYLGTYVKLWGNFFFWKSCYCSRCI